MLTTTATQHLGKPLLGMVFSATGIDPKQRTIIEKQVEQLGGIFSRPLTTQVTHLIAGDIANSEKYKSSKQLGIPIIDTSFVDEVVKNVGGNISDLIAKHLIKPLHQCRICLTGFDQEEIEDIKVDVEILGGTLHPDLTNDCSHLVVHERCELNGNVKIKYAKAWNIPILKHDWLKICLRECYLIEMTEFMIVTNEDETVLEEDLKTTVTMTQFATEFLQGCTIFCTDQIANFVISAGAKVHDVVDDQLTHYIIQDRVLNKEHQDLLQKLDNVKVVYDDWIVECMKVGERLDEGPFLPTFSSNMTPKVMKPSTETSGRKFFGLKSSGSKMSLPLKGYVFSNISLNTQTLLKLGATLSEEGLRITDKMITTRTDGNLLTTTWLEAVEKAGKFLDFGDKWYYRPLHVIRSTNLSGHIICLTGFDAIEREAIKVLIETCKGECTDSFTKRNTLIIAVAKSSGPKIAKAREIGLQIVKLQWLLDSIGQGELLPFKDYSIIPVNGSNVKDTPPPIQIETPIKEQLTRRLIVPSPLIKSRDPLMEETQSNTADTWAILKGCVIAISHRLWHRRQQLHDAVVELGALFIWTYDSSCTHYIHAGVLPNEIFQEFRVVSKAGKHIVHPVWIEKCKEMRGRVSESEYPHTYNENAKRNFEEEIGDVPLLQVKRFPSPLQVDLPSGLGLETFNQLIHNPLQTLPPPSLNPTATLPNQSSPIIRPMDGRLFVLSGASSSVRSSLKYRLSKLGASLSKSADLWDPLATHLLCAKPSGSEKFFAAMAAGIPILKFTFIEESYKARRFLEEEEFGINETDAETELEGRLIKAMKGWREQVISTGKRAFDGWRVIVLMEDINKAASVERVLIAGGAEMVEAFPTHILYTGNENKAKAELIKGSNTLVKVADYFSEHLLKGP